MHVPIHPHPSIAFYDSIRFDDLFTLLYLLTYEPYEQEVFGFAFVFAFVFAFIFATLATFAILRYGTLW